MNMQTYIRVFRALWGVERVAQANTVLELQVERGPVAAAKLVAYRHPVLLMLALFSGWFVVVGSIRLLSYLTLRPNDAFLIGAIPVTMVTYLMIGVIGFFGPRTRMPQAQRWCTGLVNFLGFYPDPAAAQKALLDAIEELERLARALAFGAWISAVVFVSYAWLEWHSLLNVPALVIAVVVGAGMALFIVATICVFAPLAWMRRMSRMLPEVSSDELYA